MSGSLPAKILLASPLRTARLRGETEAELTAKTRRLIGCSSGALCSPWWENPQRRSLPAF